VDRLQTDLDFRDSGLKGTQSVKARHQAVTKSPQKWIALFPRNSLDTPKLKVLLWRTCEQLRKPVNNLAKKSANWPKSYFLLFAGAKLHTLYDFNYCLFS
jgi:hypothetical protein